MRFAILASLVFHLLLLWPELPRTPNSEASLLQATLRPPSPTTPAAAAPAPSPPPAPARPSGGSAGTQAEPTPVAADTVAGSAPAPRPPVLASRETDPPQSPQVLPAPAKPAAPVSPQAPRPASLASAVATPAPTPVAAAASTSGVLLTQANATGEALDGLRGYRLSVATQARSFKRYPREAMAEGWAGSTEVRLEVGSDGRPRAVTVARSSGHEELDRAALTMIDSGARRARLPESLRGKSFAVLLPVVFNLEDE